MTERTTPRPGGRPGLSVRLGQRAPIPLDAEFECGAGEVMALVGPSGSGKSTILRCIAGLHAPETGTIRMNGETWLDTGARVALPPQRRRVGLVFQHYALFPHLDALDNVAAAMGHLPADQRAERAAGLLELVNLGGLDRRKPANLSGGQQQRVALARALARDPQVLLLDEPFSAVDQVTRTKLHAELMQLRRTLVLPIIFVTHNLEEASALADRLCILHHGVTLQAGTPHDIMAHPASPLVARLIDHRNIFDARLESRDDDTGAGRIAWAGRSLEVADAGGFTPGDAVSWVIPPAQVLLHRRGRPSRGERENPVDGRVVECLDLGHTVNAMIEVSGGGAQDDAPAIVIRMPAHAAARNSLAAGEAVTVSLLADAIHLMAPGGPGDATS